MNEVPNLYDEPNRRANAVFYAIHWELASALFDCGEVREKQLWEDWIWEAQVSWKDFEQWIRGKALPAASCERIVAAGQFMRRRIDQLRFDPRDE